MSGRDWDASVYHRVSAPQLAWGEAVLARLELRGDETVLDAGCGSGRLTAKLLERVPRGRVIALDASPAMLAEARRTLAPFGDRVTFVHAALGRDGLPTGVDVVFSTATFHWVLDHDALFRGVAAALVPGGRLHAQCGGRGNVARAHAGVLSMTRWRPFFESMPEPWNFAGPDQTRERLARAGFTEIEVSLQEEPTPFADEAAYAEFVRAVVLRPFLGQLPEPEHDAFVADATAVAARDTPPLTLDYVRLNLRARRAS